MVITSSGKCSLSMSIVLNNTNAVSATVTVDDNHIDEGPGAVAFVCTLIHTVNSADAYYQSAVPKTLTLSVINNDVADAKLQLPAGN